MTFRVSLTRLIRAHGHSVNHTLDQHSIYSEREYVQLCTHMDAAAWLTEITLSYTYTYVVALTLTTIGNVGSLIAPYHKVYRRRQCVR